VTDATNNSDLRALAQELRGRDQADWQAVKDAVREMGIPPSVSCPMGVCWSRKELFFFKTIFCSIIKKVLGKSKCKHIILEAQPELPGSIPTKKIPAKRGRRENESETTIASFSDCNISTPCTHNGSRANRK
jgi:hypothetical protein